MIETLRKYNFWEKSPSRIGYWRERYISNISKYLNNSLVKVILGQRRAGKSYLLRMIIQHLIQTTRVSPQNILYINKDIHELEFIQDSQALLRTIGAYQKELNISGKIYIFLDEVQEIADWEKAVNSLSQDYMTEYELFITGSNAKLLSAELSTYISGRYLRFEVFPFSYQEYLGLHQYALGKQSFVSYLQAGGMPESYGLADEEMKVNYYRSLKDSILLRDIVHRHKIRDIELLERLIALLTDSIGSYFSVNSVVKYLRSKGTHTNFETIGAYLSYLQDAYFIHESPRYDLKGKKILSGEKKYYLNDIGFKYFLASSFDFGIGKYLENIVFLYLKHNGYSVYTGKIKDQEIDFIAEKQGSKTYIQVAYLLADDAVVEREFGNLQMIPDHYEKIVITMDDVNFGSRQGIKHIQAWEALADHNGIRR